jgi:hypothetical protein
MEGAGEEQLVESGGVEEVYESTFLRAEEAGEEVTVGVVPNVRGRFQGVAKAH